LGFGIRVAIRIVIRIRIRIGIGIMVGIRVKKFRINVEELSVKFVCCAFFHK
jgi:hypothetical protein